MTDPRDFLTDSQRAILAMVKKARQKGVELHPFWEMWEETLERQQEQKQGQGIKST